MEFKATLVELSSLQELHINAQRSVVKLFCAYNGDKCLNNPDGLRRLELRFSEARYSKKNPQKVSRKSGFELYGKLRLPKVIDYLAVDSKRKNANHKRSEIFDLIENEDDIEETGVQSSKTGKRTFSKEECGDSWFEERWSWKRSRRR